MTDRIKETFLRVLAASADRDPMSVSLTEKEWGSLYRLSSRHRLECQVYDTLVRGGCGKDMPEALRSLWRSRTMAVLRADQARNLYWKGLCGKLEEAGIPFLVVKGCICKSCYPVPELRPSSDEDILISPEDYERTRQLLAGLGYAPLQKTEGRKSYETGFANLKTGLYVEIHTSLFDRKSAAFSVYNQPFEKALAMRVPFQTYGGFPVMTLPPALHLLYLFLHAARHIAYSGVGIRQLMDISLFIRRMTALSNQGEGKALDWAWFWKEAGRLQIALLSLNMLDLCRRHLGLKDACGIDWEKAEPDSGTLLEDILQGGIYGQDLPERLHSANMTVQAFSGRGRKDSRAAALKGALFPPYSYMAKRYPLLEERPFLLGPMYLHRILSYMTGREGQSGGGEQILKKGMERIRLLDQYQLRSPSPVPDPQNRGRILSTGAFLDSVREMIEAGETVRVPVAGSSMVPFLAPGRDAVLIAKAEGPYRRGEILFYTREGGRYVCHRLHHADGQGLYFAGDAQSTLEGPIPEGRVFARVTKVYRKGRWIGPDSPVWIFYERVWLLALGPRERALHLWTGIRHRL